MDGPDALRQAVREQVKYGADWIKPAVTGGVMSAATRPELTLYTDDEIRTAVDEAHRLGRRITVHAIGAPGSQVVLITGATGTGKTFLACALGQAACRHGCSTRYFRLPLLLQELAMARADGSYPKFLDRLQKTELLVIDDYGLAALTEPERRDLLEVLEDRHARRATLVTSQLPLEHWHEIIGDATFGDAILDRLVHHAHHIQLKGGSMRRRKASQDTPDNHAQA